MPYNSISELPPNLDVLPTGAKRIYMATFNQVMARGGSEDSARRVAWSAVKNKYKKNSEGDWEKK